MPLTDAQWARIEPLLPDRTPRRGGRWRDHREVIDAIAWKFQTGSQWIHLPEKYGNWRGVYNRLRMWALDSTWERVFTALVAQADADEDLNWTVDVASRCRPPSNFAQPACCACSASSRASGSRRSWVKAPCRVGPLRELRLAQRRDECGGRFGASVQRCCRHRHG
ncbi:transposase [Streptomyces pratensis]|uniref:transposase n=1 Tax=Streptomyces pratensis TaxID=1169025 RepID=UPI00362A1615